MHHALIALRILIALAELPSPSGLYDEDLASSMPIRVNQWKQMQSYIDRLPLPSQRPATLEPADPHHFAHSIGYPPPGFVVRPVARMQKTGEDSLATYYRCWLRVTPEMETYGLYLVPKRLVRPAPIVVAQHGGVGYPELATFRNGGNYRDMVRGATRRGYVVFVPLLAMDYLGDRRRGSPVPADVRARFDRELRRRGTTLAAVEVARITRALDGLLGRPEVDRTRVAMIGLSYGGLYAMYTASLDHRIRVAVTSCAFWDPEPRPTPEAMDGVLFDLAGHELLELIQPRPIQIQVGIRDTHLDVEVARRAIAKGREHYRGNPERLEYLEFDGGHEFRGEVVWPFLDRNLRKKRQ